MEYHTQRASGSISGKVWNFIEGNGAIIDLQGGTGIWVYGDDIVPANVDMEYFTLMNGEWYGVFFGGMATGNITNCNY